MGCKQSKLENTNFNTPFYSLNGKTLNGKIVYVYDGDTLHIVFNIDNKFCKFNCRLINIDSPEIRTTNKKEHESAIKSRNYLLKKVTNISLINENLSKNDIKNICSESRKLITVKCFEFDKYGRLLVELFDNNLSINNDMINQKLAVKYDGGTKKQYTEI